jgi:hypothetical protein
LKIVDPNDVIDDDDSEDVMDLDNTEVVNFLDINHEFLPREEGVGFEDWINQRLDAIDEDEKLQEILDNMDDLDAST